MDSIRGRQEPFQGESGMFRRNGGYWCCRRGPHTKAQRASRASFCLAWGEGGDREATGRLLWLQEKMLKVW